MLRANRTWAIVIVIIILALIVVALTQRPGAPAVATDTSTSTASFATSSAQSTSTKNGVTGTGNFQVTGDTMNIKIPDFRSAIQFSPNIQADVKTALQNAANTLQMRLAVNSLDLKSWIDLGTVRKMAGDYKGAESAWLFVTQAAPTNSIAFNNLGDLYMNFIKNYPKAEQSYLTAIKISPQDEAPYLDLYTMYSNLYKKGTSAAEDILKKGAAAVPDSVGIHIELARYYKAKGDTADAKMQYEAAIAAATKAGQTSLVSQIQTEENQ